MTLINELLSEIETISIVTKDNTIEVVANMNVRSPVRVALRNYIDIVDEQINFKDKQFTLIFTLKDSIKAAS